MRTSRNSPLRLREKLAKPKRFVAQLITAEVLAKRGRGPLERKGRRTRSPVKP
ncbi:MAG: hypothetical protein AAF500_19490 [Myxococcota bacterium]